jgi:hypothetical protein
MVAGSRAFGACVMGAALLVAGCSSSGGKQSTPKTATKASVPRSTATAAQSGNNGLDLRLVDWKSASVPGKSCLRTQNIRLHNGRALLPDSTHGRPIRLDGKGVRYDLLELGNQPVLYGDGIDDAAVSLYCNNNGGTADGAILYSVAVYSGKTGKRTYLGLITPRHQPKGRLPTLLSITGIAPDTITVHEQWYGPKDMTCCPEGRATTKWSLADGSLVPVTTIVTSYPVK